MPEVIHSLFHLFKKWNSRTNTTKSESIDIKKVFTLTKIDSLETFGRNGQVHCQRKENFQLNPNHEVQLKEFRKEMLEIIELLEARIEKKFSTLHELLNDIAAQTK